MTDWIDVPVADVQIGDEVKVDGIGEKGGKAINLAGIYWNAAAAIEGREFVLGPCEIPNLPGHGYKFRRSSIVAVRRRKPEPGPKPGDWRHARTCSSSEHYVRVHECCRGEVYRASSGWSKDTRTGQPWVMRDDTPVEFAIMCYPGDSITAFRNAEEAVLKSWPPRPGESVAAYYKRIGLDVRPVERRKR